MQDFFILITYPLTILLIHHKDQTYPSLKRIKEPDFPHEEYFTHTLSAYGATHICASRSED